MAGGGTASQLLPRLIAAILRRKAAQNLATFETVYSSHITGRCAAVVAACALGMVNRNNKTHEGMIGSCMRFTMSDKSKYTLKLSKWSRHPTPFAQLVKKVFLTSWWTGEQAPPPLPPPRKFCLNPSGSGRKTCKEAIFSPENGISLR